MNTSIVDYQQLVKGTIEIINQTWDDRIFTILRPRAKIPSTICRLSSIYVVKIDIVHVKIV